MLYAVDRLNKGTIKAHKSAGTHGLPRHDYSTTRPQRQPSLPLTALVLLVHTLNLMGPSNRMRWALGRRPFYLPMANRRKYVCTHGKTFTRAWRAWQSDRVIHRLSPHSAEMNHSGSNLQKADLLGDRRRWLWVQDGRVPEHGTDESFRFARVSNLAPWPPDSSAAAPTCQDPCPLAVRRLGMEGAACRFPGPEKDRGPVWANGLDGRHARGRIGDDGSRRVHHYLRRRMTAKWGTRRLGYGLPMLIIEYVCSCTR